MNYTIMDCSINKTFIEMDNLLIVVNIVTKLLQKTISFEFTICLSPILFGLATFQIVVEKSVFYFTLFTKFKANL